MQHFRIEAAAETTNILLGGGSWGHHVDVGSADGESRFTYVSPTFFATLGIPLIEGHNFTDADTNASLLVLIVNQAFVRKYISAPSPLGVQVHVRPEPQYPERTYQIIGVVADTKYGDLRQDPPAQAFVPIAQLPVTAQGPGATILIASHDPAAAQRAVRRVLDKVSPGLGELGPDGGSMKPPRRFTLDNRGRHPSDWTRDSQSILFDSWRNGKGEVFKQGLNDGIAETVVEGPGDDDNGRISPDGPWLLYRESTYTAPGAPPSAQRLMRRPVAGGSPEMVLEEPPGLEWGYTCPLKAGSPCVLGQKDAKDFVFYSLDPVRGRRGQLGKIEVSEGGFTDWGVSPDGSRLALVSSIKYRGRIEVLTLSDGIWHEFSPEPEWGDLQSIAWSADGKGFFVTSWLPDSFNLPHVTLDGKVKPLLRNGHRQWMFNPTPSHDGKYLAFQGQTWDSNVWMLEGF